MASEAAGQASGGAARTILVVDDDADQRRLVAELLWSHGGYAVVSAADGQEALDLLSEGLRPALVVLDLTMPRMDGWCFLQHLRGPVRSIVPVLVMSAVSTGSPPHGADACLEKPLDPSEFCSVVARFCAGRTDER